MMDNTINIIGDSHDLKSLRSILKKYDHIISLGDIANADKDEFLKNVERFRKSWKAFAKKDFTTISKEDADWFKEINVFGMIKQLDQIAEFNKDIIVNQGNSDFAMLSFFKECRTHLELTKQNSKFKFIEKPSIIKIGNIQLFFLPYSDEPYKLQNLFKKIYKNMPLFILAHCPAFKEAKKQYYKNHYQALKEISEYYSGDVYYIHGHVHPSNSYIYKKEELPNVIFLTPKAEEGTEGFGINHHILQINTKTGQFSLIDSINEKAVSFIELPKKFMNNEDHWNNFNP